MKLTYVTAMLVFLASNAVAQDATEGVLAGPCADQSQQATSPDPAENPDGFGQLVGERGETNANTETDGVAADGGDAYTGDPAYGDCDGR
jgi:hypothetical protein